MAAKDERTRTARPRRRKSGRVPEDFPLQAKTGQRPENGCRPVLFRSCAGLLFLVAVAEMRVGLGLAAMLAMLGNVDLLQIALAAALVMRAAAHIAGNTDIFHIVASFRLRVVCAAACKIYTCLAQSFVV